MCEAGGPTRLHGITRRVPLALEVTGFGPDPYGGTRLGVSATGKINRKDFGMTPTYRLTAAAW